VYRGMDIGTAKASRAEQAQVPHHLLDIRDPAEAYSAGDFVSDASAAVRAIQARGRLPVLVGGTQLYLRALLRGLAALPTADPELRSQIEAQARRQGWPALHRELARIDPMAAARIHPNDPQRIQRAIEVHRLTGRTISDWQAQTRAPLADVRWVRIALIPGDHMRHAQILVQRFDAMLAAGLEEEVRSLYERGDLHAELPAIRAVGYRQLWPYCAGSVELASARALAITATQQLAKRQRTWIRADPAWRVLEPAIDSTESEVVAALGEPGC